VIGKQDILERAAEWQLRPEVVEKDYVLGWLLAGIASHPETARQWVFKGGTALKKCYFETYRFSEDLDFSLLPDAAYAETDLKRVLLEVARRTAELSGIVFQEETVVARPRTDKHGRTTFEGKLAYQGPLAVPSWPRVLLDLTRHEPVLDHVTQRVVFHPYPDALPDGTRVSTYSLEELFAEKTRALFERTRPRDLYDVAYISQNLYSEINLDHARELFQGKCHSKRVRPPTASDLLTLVRDSEELKAEWVNMLAHQVPQLPPVDVMLERLPAALLYLEPGAIIAPAPGPAPTPAGQMLEAPPGVHFWGVGVPLEVVRFAGANRLLVEFTYNGERRAVEPYSLRRAGTGNILLYGWEQGSTHIKAFITSKMDDIRATGIPFVPRYQIEFAPTGSLRVPPAASAARPVGAFGRPARSRSGRRSSRRAGPTYIFQCPVCQKKFYRSTNNPNLRSHKDRGGYSRCSGRRGYLLAIK
jgi:predicted nucleotidyltransferase component of viral defense system